MKIVLVTDLIGIWFSQNQKYKKFIQNFLKRHKAKSMKY